MKNKIVLSVSHHIYLTREQRYSLNDGEDIQVIGISVPVWFHNGTTSEPADEVFCLYSISNDKETEPLISTNEKGYYINLPNSEFKPPSMSNDKWRAMSIIERERWYEGHQDSITSKNLLDYQDGGGKYMGWRHDNKIYKNKKALSIKNWIEIKDIEFLEKSLTL